METKQRPRLDGPTTVRTLSYVAFHEDSPLSDFHICKVPFKFKDHSFTNSAAAYAYEKAKFFGNKTAQLLVLQCHNQPAACKAIGREIRPDNEGAWSYVRMAKMYDVCHAKFQADKDLRDYLVDTGARMLIDADPLDDIWGVGLAPNHKLIGMQKQWRGLNLHGAVLMRLRKEERIARQSV